MSRSPASRCGWRRKLEAGKASTLVSFGQRDASAHGFGAEDGDDLEDGESGGGFSDESGGAADDDDEL